jgi:anti-sigma factor RsiW
VSSEGNHVEMSCRDVVALVTDYLEGAMPSEDRLLFETHLAWCAPCVRYLEEMRQTIALTGRLLEEDLEPEWRDAMLRIFGEFRP